MDRFLVRQVSLSEESRSVLLRAKAQDGVKVRIMLGDPDSPAVAMRTYEERIPIAGRVAMAIAYYRPLLGAPGIEFRQHATCLYNSIFRADMEQRILTVLSGP